MAFPRPSQRGITLIELLFVVAIVAIVIALVRADAPAPGALQRLRDAAGRLT